MQHHEWDVKKVEILLGDTFFEIADDGIHLESQRTNERAKQRHANFDRATRSQDIERVQALVLDEAAHLAQLVHLQIRQHSETVVDAPAVDLLDRKQWALSVA